MGKFDRPLSAHQGLSGCRERSRDFDVFLCHNGADKPAVKKVGEQQIKQIKSAAVFVGKNGRGPWQDKELYAFLRQFLKRDCPIIPVILPDCENAPELPPFLESMTWVEFRNQEPDPLQHLIWGITGERGLM